mgnify:CR=1 FL=1
MSVLIINPEAGHTDGPEEALWYISPYFEQIRDVVAQRGKDYTYLYREQCIKDQVWRQLNLKKPKIIVATGHGDSNLYTGYYLDWIFWVDMKNEGFNPNWAAGTIMLMLSCLTARGLGPYMMDNGASYYLGWKVEYGFAVEPEVRKEENSIEQFFFKPIEQAFSRVAVGDLTPKECFDYIARRYTENAQKVPPHIKELMLSDRDNMVLLPVTTAPILLADASYASLGLAVGLGMVHLLNPPQG